MNYPRVAPKAELHPCPLCYRPMHDLVCPAHGEMEWCRQHNAAYLPGTHVCEPPPRKTPQPAKPKSKRKRRKWQSKYVKKFPQAHCIVCGVEVSRGGPNTHFCGEHRRKWYGRFRYLTSRRQHQTGLPNFSIEEAIEMIREQAHAA